MSAADNSAHNNNNDAEEEEWLYAAAEAAQAPSTAAEDGHHTELVVDTAEHHHNNEELDSIKEIVAHQEKLIETAQNEPKAFVDSNNNNNSDQNSDEDDSDIEVVIGEINADMPGSGMQSSKMKDSSSKNNDTPSGVANEDNLIKTPQNGPITAFTPSNLPSLNAEFFGNYEGGKTMAELDLDAFSDKPWNQPGADITDYFNYGFNEASWRSYCQKQHILRQMYGNSVQNPGVGNAPNSVAENQHQQPQQTASHHRPFVFQNMNNYGFNSFHNAQQSYSNFPLAKSRIGYSSSGGFITDLDVETSADGMIKLTAESTFWDHDEQLKNYKDESIVKPVVTNFISVIGTKRNPLGSYAHIDWGMSTTHFGNIYARGGGDYSRHRRQTRDLSPPLSKAPKNSNEDSVQQSAPSATREELEW